MFEKILIANRGEIACRIIQTAKRLNIKTVAVYSAADAKAQHVLLADEAVFIGPAPSTDSYLKADVIIDAAKQTGAQAIHPGYGFLSENARFAELCSAEKLVFIGPPASAIRAMGSKSAAKSIMEEAGVPLVPGYHGDDQSPVVLKQSADDMGYPVLLKAVAGGGGKGMRQVWSESEFTQALDDAKREAKASFGKDDMLVEKYLTQPRHVEVQVFCDGHGNGVYLFERDCSIQRRHQKILEEAPAPNLPQGVREKMGDAAVTAAQAIDYVGAGTVEFLLDTDGSFYFMEMNTRLQVEHPVTEMITGQDLVEWQLQVATGAPLPLRQSELRINGHAFEARIYAEDANNDFMPSTGTLTYLAAPNENRHVRVDTGVRQGDEVTPYYDPMIAKLIVWDTDRDKAVARLSDALAAYHIAGVTTNIPFLHRLANHTSLIDADLDTGFIGKHHESLFGQPDKDAEDKSSRDRVSDSARAVAPLACLFLQLHREQMAASHLARADSPWDSASTWRLNQANVWHDTLMLDGACIDYSIEVREHAREADYLILIDDQTIEASGTLQNNTLTATLNGHRTTIAIASHDGRFTAFVDATPIAFSSQADDLGVSEEQQGASDFRAPMNGTIVEVKVSQGDEVDAGAVLLVMEAMKMQHTIKAPSKGTISALFCQQGDLVDGGSELLTFEAAAE